jgi:hypothetical protein
LQTALAQSPAAVQAVSFAHVGEQAAGHAPKLATGIGLKPCQHAGTVSVLPLHGQTVTAGEHFAVSVSRAKGSQIPWLVQAPASIR